MFGNKLKELRIKKLPPKGITQEEVANALGIPRGTYAHYELNKRQPDADMIVKLADFFGVSTDYLLGNDKPVEKKANPDSETLEIISLFDKLPEDKKALVLAMARAMVND